MGSVLPWFTSCILLCLLGMAEERKLFLQHVKKTIEKAKPKKREMQLCERTAMVHNESRLRTIGSEKSERSAWMASLKGCERSESSRGSKNQALAEPAQRSVKSFICDFSIRSIENFFTRASMTGTESATVRKRPHYDNRLRRLNCISKWTRRS